MTTIINFLTSRKSIRDFDAQFNITNNELTEMLEEAATAPSSNNLQPWKVVAVKNKEIQLKISELAFGQTSVRDASAIFILFADTSKYLDAKEITSRMVAKGIYNQEMATKQEQTVTAFFELHPEDKQAFGGALDTGLFAMNLIHIIRAHGYATVPMRGALFAEIQKLLEIPSDWVPIMLLPVGKPLNEGYESIRYKAEEFSTIIE